MRDHCPRVLVCWLIAVLLMLGVGASLLHNHTDGGDHDDCLACEWLVYAVSVPAVFLLLRAFICPLLFGKLCALPPAPVTLFYHASRHLRSPPLPA